MNDYIEHHGIKGMKWGIRRFQNEDGSLTPDGKKRYSYKDAYKIAREQSEISRDYKRTHPTAYLYEREDYARKQIRKKYGKEAVDALVTYNRINLAAGIIGAGITALRARDFIKTYGNFKPFN